MATEKWSGITSRGSVLTDTQLGSLGNGSYSAVGPSFDNTGNLDRFAYAELNTTFGSAPTANYMLHLYAVKSLDGTHYTDGGGSVAPADSLYLGSFQVQAVTTAQRVQTLRFELPPTLCEFILLNSSGAALPATGNTVSLYTFNRTVG